MDNDTSDLLSHLKNVRGRDQLEEYLESIDDIVPGSFAEYANELLRAKGMAITDLIKASYMERTYVHQIMNGRKNPRKDKIIQIAIACGWTFEQTQRGLEIAGEEILYSKNRRDALIIYALNNDLGIRGTNELLASHREKELE